MHTSRPLSGCAAAFAFAPSHWRHTLATRHARHRGRGCAVPQTGAAAPSTQSAPLGQKRGPSSGPWAQSKGPPPNRIAHPPRMRVRSKWNVSLRASLSHPGPPSAAATAIKTHIGPPCPFPSNANIAPKHCTLRRNTLNKLISGATLYGGWLLSPSR
jgi:hypothetical protein